MNPAHSSGEEETEPTNQQDPSAGTYSIDPASFSICREDCEDKRTQSFDSYTTSESTHTNHRSEPSEDTFSTESEVLNETSGKRISLKTVTISATQPPSLPTELDFPRAEDRKASVGASADFVPCSQNSFHSASIVLATKQQLDINRKKREEAINSELRTEEQLKKERRLQLEKTLRTEAEEKKRLLELKRQEEEQRINEERRRQQLLDEEKRLEEERQRRELLKRQESERYRKEAEIQKQKAIEDQIRRRKEEKARLERQCDFPASANIKPITMHPSTATQHHHSDARASANGQHFYPYKDPKRQHQHQRSGTMSSNGETPMKFRSTRNQPHDVPSQQKDHSNTPDTPTLFIDRIENEEVAHAQIKTYTEIIQNQSREIIELKKNNDEMESRLEQQTQDRIELESTIEDQEIHWTKSCEGLEGTVESYKKSLEAEKNTNKKLWDLVYKKEKEIQKAYVHQRRFDGSLSQQGNRRAPHQRNSPGERQRGPTEQRPSTALNRHRSPLLYVEEIVSAQNVQERAAMKLLEGFMGL
jgi:hypothetical protein